MPAKTQSDLHDHSVVCISKPGGYWISVVSNDAISDVKLVSPPTDMTIMVQAINDLWRVVDVEAENGWGPFLYDLAIELATLNGGRLTGHEHKISESSEAVWRHYHEKRSDVTREPLPEYCVAALPAELRNSLQKPASTIADLKKSGKWIELSGAGG